MLYNCTPSSSSYVTTITKRFYNLNPCNSIALFQASDLPFRLSNHSLINTKSYKVLLLDILSYFLFCRFNPSTMVKTKDLTLSPDVILPGPEKSSLKIVLTRTQLLASLSGFLKWGRLVDWWGCNLSEMVKNCMKIKKSTFLPQNSERTWGWTRQFFGS